MIPHDMPPDAIAELGRSLTRRRFFEQGEAKPGFPRAGHPQHDAVGHEVLGVVKEQIVPHFFRLGVIATTEVELSELFVIT
jgi:hypothetical protein